VADSEEEVGAENRQFEQPADIEQNFVGLTCRKRKARTRAEA